MRIKTVNPSMMPVMLLLWSLVCQKAQQFELSPAACLYDGNESTSDSYNNDNSTRNHNITSTLRMGLSNRHQVRAMQASFLAGRLVLSTTHVAVQLSTSDDCHTVASSS